MIRRSQSVPSPDLGNGVIKITSLSSTLAPDLRLTPKATARGNKVDFCLSKLYASLSTQSTDDMKECLSEARATVGTDAFRSEVRRIQPLHTAVWKGAELALEVLLQDEDCRLLVNQDDNWGRTPLMVAASRGQVGCTLALLIHGADWRTRDSVCGHTVLHKAALSGHDTMLALLLTRGCTSLLEARDNRGRTALMAAVERGHIKCVEVLEEFGAKLDIHCLKRQNVIHIAASSGNASMLEELLKRSKLLSLYRSVLQAKDVDGYTSLMLAVMTGNSECVRVLLRHSNNKQEIFEEFKYNPLYLAAKMGHSHIVQLLLISDDCLRLNFPPDVDERLTRKYAQNGEIYLEDLLILHGEKACVLINSILQDTNSDPRISLKLEKYTELFARYRTTCLHLAAMSGCVKTLEIFYSCYANISLGKVTIMCNDIDKRNALNQTPLHLAALTGSVECVRFLVQKGGNLAATISSPRRFRHKSETSAVSILLGHVPNGEQIISDALDECITVKGQVLGHQDIFLDFSLLCPEGEKRLLVLQEMYKYRDRKMYTLLKHPLAQALIYREWNKAKYSILLTIHFISYLLYVCLLAVYFLMTFDDFIRSILRTVLFVHCFGMLLILFPFQVLGDISKTEILYRITTKLCPHVLTFVALIMDYKPLSSFALISTWLTITHFTNIVPFLSYKFAMFQFITKKLVDHIFVFMYILTGFSVTFYLLYNEDEDSAFRTIWESVLSTTVVVMQGDLSGTPLFKSANETTIPHDVLVAGGIMQQLFVVIVVLALLNMWVGLAVRSGREMERQGHINYHRNQVRVLVIMEEIFTMMFANNAHKSNRERNSVLVSEGDLPNELYSALKCNANQRNIQRVNLVEIAQSLTRLSEKVDGIEKKLNDLQQKRFIQFKDYLS